MKNFNKLFKKRFQVVSYESKLCQPVFRKGVQVGCSPLEKFSCKKSQRGDEGKNLPPPRFLRSLSENLKGGTKGNFDLSWEKLKEGTKGYFDLSWEKSWRGDQRIFWLELRKTFKRGPKDILTWVKKNLEGGTKGNFLD